MASILSDDVLRQEKIMKKKWQGLMKRGYKPVISCFENLDCKRKNFTGTNTIERRIESKLFFCLPSRYCFTTSILDSSKYLLFSVFNPPDYII